MTGPHIGLNLAYLEPGNTGGMEVYARALVPRLPDAWPQARFTAFCARELAEQWRAAPWDPRVRLVELPFSAASRVRRTGGEQTLVAGAALRARVDLLHSLANIAPLGWPRPSVLTVHDLIYKRFPDTHAGLLTHGVALLVPASVRRATRVITVSHSGAADLEQFFGTPAAKIDVVPSGPGVAPGSATPEPQLRARLGLGDGPLVLSPSARRPHKNLPRLIEAMRDVDATLVLPGYPTDEDARLRELAGADVVFCGWVSDADLEGLYAAATCLAFPSLAEGFGLPVLEAMRRGLPVACSDTSSLPEVAGDAALLFDPLDTGAIAAAVGRLVDDGALRARLATAGRDQAARFSWDRAAAGTVASYRRALR